MSPDVFVIAGPTASGKTDVGIQLAQKLDGEIISADARQIYRWMDIGTAKPTEAEQAAAHHHLIDVINPHEQYSAGQFARDAAGVTDDLLDRGKVPIVVGGAGLYLSALFDGFSPIPDIPLKIRQRLQHEAGEDLARLFDRLSKVDTNWANNIASTDTQRIVRGLEVFEATGRTLTEFQNEPRVPLGSWSCAWFGLNWPRETLYDRINQRAEKMIEDGLVAEVSHLLDMGFTADLNALNTFGYREIIQFLDGTLTRDEALREFQQGTRRYAKRQMTWFRRESRMEWIDPTTDDPVTQILNRIENA